MTVEELIIYGKKHLHSHQVKMLLSNILECDTLELLNYLDKEISPEDVDKYKKMIDSVKNNKPLQYVLGNVNFYGNVFDINENVLIPRFETEELVEKTLEFIKNNLPQHSKVIDLGCGSGVIGITLKKKLPTLSVTCLDISDDALDVTNKNKEKLNADIKVIKGDMLDNITDKFHVIISNPPYISNDEVIDELVFNNEPHLALFAEENGLYFYDKILSTCKKNLKDKFLISFEIGMTQRDSITNLANKYLDNIKVECFKDLQGKDRILFIYN